MKRLCLILLLLCLTKSLYAQPENVTYTQTDKKAMAIPVANTKTTEDIAAYITQNFNTETDKARAIFIWLTENIAYDIENVFALNFYEKDEDRIKKALITHKGICAHYAALFHDISGKVGLTSYIIEGYTKQNGFTDYIPHAWCAARINNTWYLFDPTWGSGYVNNNKFYKKLNNDYFKALPTTLIASHMPFDYLWQFLNYPVSNQEFYEGKTDQDNTKPFFDYTDSIAAYNKLDHVAQMEASARRIEKNGLKNAMLFDRLQHLKLEIERESQNNAVNSYNSAVADFNDAVNHFNTYISYYNKQFNPTKPDAEIQEMIDVVNRDIQASQNKLNAVKTTDNNLNTMIQQMHTSLGDLAVRVEEQQAWVEKYLGKSKLIRKTMFHKYTWMGVPLN